MSIRRAFIILTFALCISQIQAADLRQQWDQPSRKWIKGPVRGLVTPEEEKQFKALKTDAEIAAFVKDFWARRDPTPGTPENEFADLFWKRVGEAEKRFPQTTEPGALSDRGQVYLLLGPPTRTPNPGKTMDWIYENIPNVNPGTFTIQFTSGGGGNPLLLGKKGFEQIVATNEFLRGLGPKAAEVYAPKPKPQELPAAIEVAPPVEVATEESKILDDNALNDSLPSAVPFQVRTDFYQATKGDTFVVLTFAVARKDAGATPLVAFARLAPYASEMKPLTLAAANSFSAAEPENSDPNSAWLYFQAGVGAHPGRYSLLAGIRDPATGKLGLQRQPFEVPGYSSGSLQISTVVLSSSLRGPEAPPAAAEGKVPAYYLGSFRIVPSLDNTFHQGSSLAWYYQIYNAANDPATGKPNLTLQYEFSLLQKGEYHPVTAPQVVKNRSSQVEAFSFQLVKPTAAQKGWVEGDYKLLIKVSDEVSKNSAPPIEIPFKVVP